MDENGKPQTLAEIRAWTKAQQAETNAELRRSLHRANTKFAADLSENNDKFRDAVDGVRADMSAATVKMHEDLASVKRDRQARKDARAAEKHARADAKAARKK